MQAGLIAEALDRMGVGPALVFGHSWAGALALALALDHPERVSALALAAPVAMPMPDRMPDLPWYWRLAVTPPVAWLLSRTVGPPIARHFYPRRRAGSSSRNRRRRITRNGRGRTWSCGQRRCSRTSRTCSACRAPSRRRARATARSAFPPW
ncbi:alpha/beta fold hydrolase [Methylobacterium oryzae CBMB20]